MKRAAISTLSSLVLCLILFTGCAQTAKGRHAQAASAMATTNQIVVNNYASGAITPQQLLRIRPYLLAANKAVEEAGKHLDDPTSLDMYLAAFEAAMLEIAPYTEGGN